MPNSLKVRLGKLKYKGIISDKDYERLCKALKQEPCKDAISRELALREIDKYMCGVPFDEKTLDVIIKELPLVTPKAGWIPCNERLPKAGEYVGDVEKHYLVQNEYGDMLVARYTHSEYWEQVYQTKPIADEVVAWMPLPEPYTEESEGKE